MAKKQTEMCMACNKATGDVGTMIQIRSNLHLCDGCIETMHSIAQAQKRKKDVCVSNIEVKPSEIKNHLDQYVIGQEEAKRTLSVAVYNHYKRICNMEETDIGVEIQKSNILMLGSTGSGKTYLAQSIAKFLHVPFVIADATSLTEAGYVGDDVETILLRLLENANGDISLAEKGIIYIDEIDKLARKGENMSITRDVSGEGVQNSLLKLLEGSVVSVPLSGGRKSPYSEQVEINTENILFICGGAFSGIEESMKKPESKKSIGFNVISNTETDTVHTRGKVQPKDIIRFGFTPELVGRLPVITTLQPLEQSQLMQILTEPKNALVKQYQALFGMDDVKLEFLDTALERVAELANEREIGARGLRAILEQAMEKTMFEVPNIVGAKKVVITDGVIDGIEDAVVYGTRNRKLA